ncbi:MAG: serine/threonine protein kinase, partial [Rubripirellula sp.]
SEGAVVANTYLPARAVPQVTLATLLAMNTPVNGTVAVATPKAQPPLTVEEMLNRKMSVSFEQESLEFAIDSIVSAFEDKLPRGSTMPSVRIIGGDLQLMGITQNQQVRDFTKTDIPLRQVLTDLVLGANPDKTATGPQDEKQALIWVVADDEDNPGKKLILVTTRQAAEGKYELPQEFLAD